MKIGVRWNALNQPFEDCVMFLEADTLLVCSTEIRVWAVAKLIIIKLENRIEEREGVTRKCEGQLVTRLTR